MASKDKEKNRAQRAAWYAANKDSRKEYMKKYRLENAERIKEVAGKWHSDHAEQRAAQYHEWFDANAEHKRKKDRERRAALPQEVRVGLQREWRKKNPGRSRELNQERRARELNAPVVERIDRKAIYERDSGRCHICEKKVAESSFTLDHLVPLARGGDHTAANLRVAHKSCNCRRGAGRLPAQLLLMG